MPTLTKVSLTSFAQNDSHGAVVTLGGTAPKILRDGTTGEERIAPITMPTQVFLEAASRLLAPQLEAVLEESHGNLATFLAALDEAKRGAVEAHVAFAREQKRLFAKHGGQAKNLTLPTEPAVPNPYIPPAGKTVVIDA